MTGALAHPDVNQTDDLSELHAIKLHSRRLGQRFHESVDGGLIAA